MPYTIHKVSTFPYDFQADDEQVATAEHLDLVPIRLEELGFGQAKTTIVKGSTVYYKGRTNAVYVRYVQSLPIEHQNNKKVQAFSKEFYDFLWTDKMLAFLPGCGWNDGGCRSLMHAVLMWLPKSDLIEPYEIVKNPKHVVAEHAFVKVGNWFIDGDGVSTKEQLRKRWIEEEGFPSYLIIRPYDYESEPSDEDAYCLTHPELQELAALLQERFDGKEILSLLLNEGSA